MDTMKGLLRELPGGETATKTVERVEEKVKDMVQAIPVVGQSETVKRFVGRGTSDNDKQETLTEMSSESGLGTGTITPIESEAESAAGEQQQQQQQQRPQTISERVKPVLAGVAGVAAGVLPASVQHKLGMGTGMTGTGTRAGSPTEQKQEQPSFIQKIAGQLDYFATEMKEKQNSRIYARAILKGRNNIVGDLTFGQDLNTGETCLVGSVVGLPAGEHAVNIHEYGDLSQGHQTIGEHFNPFHSKKHGGLTDKERHLGDLGNITAGKDGKADVDIRDLELPLVGPYSIIGRAIEIHARGDQQAIPACDCGPDCECRISSGSSCPRAHKCAMCSAIKQMGEPIAIGLIVHCPEIKQQENVKTEAFVKPWESLRGTTD